MRTDLIANWGPIPFFVGRQPIFDRSQNIWGYQLFHRATAASVAASFEDDGEATLEIVRNIAMNPLLDPHGQTKIMITFTRENVVQSAPFAMPPGKTVVKYRGFLAEASIQEQLQELRAAGYPLAWEDDGEASVPEVSGLDILILDAIVALFAVKARESGVRPTTPTLDDSRERASWTSWAEASAWIRPPAAAPRSM